MPQTPDLALFLVAALVASTSEAPAAKAPAPPAWTDMAPPGAGDLVAVSASGGRVMTIERGALHVFDGARWQRHDEPAGKGLALRDVSVVAAGKGETGWLVADAAAVHRWDGKALTSVPSNSSKAFDVVVAVGAARAGALRDGGLVTWDGERWTSPVGGLKYRGVAAMAPLGKGFVAVGAGGLAVRVDGVGPKAEPIVETTGSDRDLRAVVGCGGAEVVAVGDVALRRDTKGVWRPLPAPPVPLSAAAARCAGAGAAPTHVAAVSGSAELFVLDVKRESWTRVTVRDGAALADVAVYKKGLVVVGKGGLALASERWP
jgi:hypothetical protein